MPRHLDENKMKPVFLIFSTADDLTSKVIRGFTHSEYSHVCICIDPDFSQIVEFAPRNWDNQGKLYFTGMQVNSYKSWKYRNDVQQLAIYVDWVSLLSFEKIKKRIEYFIDRVDETKYDMFGASIAFALKLTNRVKDSMTWFCSEFVAEILNTDKKRFSGDLRFKAPSDVLKENKFQKIWEGTSPEMRPKDIVSLALKARDNVVARGSYDSYISFPQSVADISREIFNVRSVNTMYSLARYLAGSKDITNLSAFSKATVIDGKIVMQGINYKRFVFRVKKVFGNRFDYLIEKEYRDVDYQKYMRKKISKKQMRITKIKVNEFFAMEMYYIFNTLAELYNDSSYAAMCHQLKTKTWLSNIGTTKMQRIDTAKLKSLLNTELIEYQEQFVREYPMLKAYLNLNGYILAFEQGLGKTLTSIAIAEALDKKHVYIICPNALKQVWYNELQKHVKRYSDTATLEREVRIVNEHSMKDFKNVKYFIINNEAIKLLDPYAVSGPSSMIIVDECHNFRNLKGGRVRELLDLKDRVKCNDILLCSGTPIKAKPNEIVPALLMIDPTFDMDSAEIFVRAFNQGESNSNDIIKYRFGNIMYRKTKEELNLPEKRINNLEFEISTPEKYYLSTVRNLISLRFRVIYAEKVKTNLAKKDAYVNYLVKYYNGPAPYMKLYMEKIVDPANTSMMVDLHESEKEILSAFPQKYVFPNVPPDKKKDVLRAYTDYINMRQSAASTAINEYLIPRRREMFIKLYEENKDVIIGMIENNDAKTIIFSALKPVVDYIYKDLNENGIITIKVTGDEKDKAGLVKRFKEDGGVDCLVATSQTLGTGVTLIEANQMFFFGPPWRSADYNQCVDRIHRIGQTSDVAIYNVLMKSEFKNLSMRMDEILNWSKDMFTDIIDSNDSYQKEFNIEDVVGESFNYYQEYLDNNMAVLEGHISICHQTGLF